MNEEEKKDPEEDIPPEDESGLSIEDVGLPLDDVEGEASADAGSDTDENDLPDVMEGDDGINDLMPLRIGDDEDLEDGDLLDTSATTAADEPDVRETGAIPLSALVSDQDDEMDAGREGPTVSIPSEDDRSPALELTTQKFTQMQTAISELKESFDAKIKYDAHKEKIIDALHSELQEYKNDIIQKLLHSMIMDIIKVIDDVRKMAAHYRKRSTADNNPAKILKYLETVPIDLEDVVGLHGVRPFNCKGDQFDASRQRVTKKVKTDDPEKDKTIAKSLRPGYEWDGKVIRPEMVATYHFVDETPETDMRSSDE